MHTPDEPSRHIPSRPGLVAWSGGPCHFTAEAPLVAHSAATDMGRLVVTRQPNLWVMSAVDDTRRNINGLGVLAWLPTAA